MNFDNALLAADTARMQSGGRSMFDRVSDALTAGTAGAVVSGLGSIYNTAVYASNELLGTRAQEIETGRVLADVDKNWAAYYEENKGVIDTVGFIGGAFIPGGLAVKGLNLARKGEGLGTFRNALGYTTRKQQEYLDAGLAQIAERGASVFTTINKNKIASMAFGAADNVLQMAVFETAAAITMQRNSMLVDESWDDIAWDIAKTSLVGGILGGGAEALWTNKIFRDAGKLVDSRARPYDALVAADKLNMGFGDKAFAIMDAILELPKEVLEADRKLAFSYRMNGKDHGPVLDVGALYDTKLAKTVQSAELKFQQKIVEVAATDPSVGQPLAKSLLEIYHGGKKAGKSDGEIREELGGYLFNLHSVQSLGSSAVDFSKDVFYLVPGASLQGAKVPEAAKLFSPVRPSSNARGFRVVGDEAAAKWGVLGTGEVPGSLKDAWAKGWDVVFSGTAGKVHVNPKSTIYKPLADNSDDFSRVSFNVHSKQTSDTPIVTIADMADKGVPSATVTGVQAGKYTFQFNAGTFEPTLDSVQNTARHLWASKQTSFSNTTIDASDFSVLDRIAELGVDTAVGVKLTVRMADGVVVPMEELASNYSNWLLRQKTDRVAKLLEDGAGELDTRQVAYAVNVEQGFVDAAIAAEFRIDKLDAASKTRKLESYSGRDHVVLVYKKAPIADGETPDFATGYIGYNNRKKAAMEQAQSASASVLGKHNDKFLEEADIGKLSFDGTGAGPTAGGFSNAEYSDRARRWAQDAGRATHLTQQEFRNAALDPLLPHFNRIVTENDKELGAVLNRVRLSEDRLALHNGKLVDLSSLEAYEKLAARVEKGLARPEQLDRFTFKQNWPVGEATYKFLQDYQQGHVKWLDAQRQLSAAQGRSLDWNDRALYLPPINTKQFPYFAFVKAREGRIFSGTETAMITAKTPEELAALVKQVETDHPDLQVFFKKDTEEYFKAKGDYEFQSGLNSPTLDPLLRKAGKLGDFVPTLDAKSVVEDFVTFIGRREDNLVRSAVDVKYGQTFAELRWLSDQTSKVETSKFGFLGKQDTKKIADPFGDYRRLALNISKRSEYRLWSDLNEFVDALGTRAYDAVATLYKDARAGNQDWIEANAKLEQYGMRGVFTGQENYLRAQTGQDRSLVKLAVAKGNMLLANVALRLDAANAMINTVSAPIMLGMEVGAIRSSLKRDPAMAELFERNMRLTGPEGIQVPSTVKLLHNAVGNFFGAGKTELIRRYTDDIGSIRNDASQFHDMLADIAMVPNMAPSKWAAQVDKATELGAKFTGNNWAEQFTRFVSSDVMRQITQPLVDAGKMGVKEQNSFIAIFVNRTQGNYISSQRPVMFQGVIGSAISLFQTYQFNMLQQLFRHIENRDAKTIAIGAALQSSIFGLNGLPVFDAINTHIIGNAHINEGHEDVYSKAASFDKELGDFAMYGALSAFPAFSDKAPALYTRGDLNPRHITIVPTSFQDIPIVDAFSRVIKTVTGVGSQLGNGADLSAAMLHGLEHNGISRPLAGMAQIMNGRSTTSQGSIVSAHNDLMSIATATRMLGAKPMDESVAMNHKFRMVAYQAADRERVEKLGVVIKQKIADGTLEEDDVMDFAAKYASVGGRVQGFGAAMQRWTKAATESEVNTIMRAIGTERGQRMMEVMGGDPLPDLVNGEE